MKRQSSNNVKIRTMETNATKPITKLMDNVRKRLASSKLGNPERPAPRVCSVVALVRVSVRAFRLLSSLRIQLSPGIRLNGKSITLNPSITAVASHWPIAGTELSLERDSRSEEHTSELQSPC